MEYENRIFDAVILNEPFAEYVRTGVKTKETRMRRLNLKGDTIICCDKGKSIGSPNFGKAICLVNIGECRGMVDSDEADACIGNVPGRIIFPLTNLRHFDYPFNFSDYAVTKNWQGVFRIKLPSFVNIIKPLTP